MSNYVTYPMMNMRITQLPTGTTSHKPHTTGTPKDYPIDEGGKNTGREAVYCPCDEIIIKRIYGVDGPGTNTVFFESTTKCDFADGTQNYLCGLITHSNDSDLRRLKEGQKIKRGEIICYEGTDGGVGMHAHISLGKGRLKGNGWTQNNKKKWVLTASGGTFKVEQLCYLDPTFTKVVNAKGLKFKTLPSKVEYLPKYEGKSASLVDGLKAVKVNSSFANRKKIAAVNGVKNYLGTSKQNTELLNLLKKGKCVKP